MSKPSQDDLFEKAIQTIGVIAKLPIVRVDREEFLRREFADSPNLDEIIANGPQSVYPVEALEKKAKTVIGRSTRNASMVSFAAGLPGNVAVMVPAGVADVGSYFAFALNLAQQIAFIYGEDELFDGGETQLSEEDKVRIVAYLGVMLGAGGAAALVAKVSQKAGENIGKKVAAKALTKTVWYPAVKKIGALIGQKITKKTVEKTVTKSVPVVGGIVSGGLTYVTFRPMGHRLSATFAQGLRGEIPDFTEADLKSEVRKVVEGTVVVD